MYERSFKLVLNNFSLLFFKSYLLLQVYDFELCNSISYFQKVLLRMEKTSKEMRQFRVESGISSNQLRAFVATLLEKVKHDCLLC